MGREEETHVVPVKSRLIDTVADCGQRQSTMRALNVSDIDQGTRDSVSTPIAGARLRPRP